MPPDRSPPRAPAPTPRPSHAVRHASRVARTTARAWVLSCAGVALSAAMVRPREAAAVPHATARRDTTVDVRAPDGVRLAATVIGHGRDTVLVPLAAHLAVELAPLARRRTLILYDPRGRGASDRVTDPTRLGLAHDVADLEAVRAHFGVARPAILGWSYFGMVAARYALTHPTRVARLALLAPLPPWSGPHGTATPAPRAPEHAARAADVERRLADPVARRDTAALCRAQAALEAAEVFVPDAERAAAHSDPCQHANEWPVHLLRTMLPTLEGLARYDWRPELASLRPPTLVVAGRRDPIAGPGAEGWGRAPRARVLRVDAGHAPHVDRARTVLAALDAFLAHR